MQFPRVKTFQCPSPVSKLYVYRIFKGFLPNTTKQSNFLFYNISVDYLTDTSAYIDVPIAHTTLTSM